MRIQDSLTKTSFELNPSLVRYVVGTGKSGSDELNRITLPIIDPLKFREGELYQLDRERGGTISPLIRDMPVKRDHFELIFDPKFEEWFLNPIGDVYFNGRYLSGRTQVGNAEILHLGAYDPEKTGMKERGYPLTLHDYV